MSVNGNYAFAYDEKGNPYQLTRQGERGAFNLQKLQNQNASRADLFEGRQTYANIDPKTGNITSVEEVGNLPTHWQRGPNLPALQREVPEAFQRHIDILGVAKEVGGTTGTQLPNRFLQALSNEDANTFFTSTGRLITRSIRSGVQTLGAIADVVQLVIPLAQQRVAGQISEEEYNGRATLGVGRIFVVVASATAGSKIGLFIGVRVGTFFGPAGILIGGAAGALLGGAVGAVGGVRLSKWLEKEILRRFGLKRYDNYNVS